MPWFEKKNGKESETGGKLFDIEHLCLCTRMSLRFDVCVPIVLPLRQEVPSRAALHTSQPAVFY